MHMIRTLTGTVTDIQTTALIVETGGIGYLVYCPSSTHADVELYQETKLWIHQTMTDDRIDLYGFTDPEELSLFEQLLTVSGIGPKKSLGMLTTTDPGSLKNAIASGESKHVQDVTGVGKKVADKIILELQNAFEQVDTHYTTSTDNETFEALTALGYSAKEARQALQHTPDNITDTSERVKEALKHIS